MSISMSSGFINGGIITVLQHCPLEDLDINESLG